MRVTHMVTRHRFLATYFTNSCHLITPSQRFKIVKQYSQKNGQRQHQNQGAMNMLASKSPILLTHRPSNGVCCLLPNTRDFGQLLCGRSDNCFNAAKNLQKEGGSLWANSWKSLEDVELELRFAPRSLAVAWQRSQLAHPNLTRCIEK